MKVLLRSPRFLFALCVSVGLASACAPTAAVQVEPATQAGPEERERSERYAPASTLYQSYLSDLQAVREAARTDASLQASIGTLRRQADEALRMGPFSVMDKTGVPPSGDPHDYMSLSVYWWPNPDTEDGLPYVRRDGETNPETRDGTWDKEPLMSLVESVPTLALAYYFTGHEPYADHAARLVRTWFLDEATRMNPNFNFAQAVPGRYEGRSFGIIESRRFMQIIDAVGLLEASGAWTAADDSALRTWFGDYLDWLLESDFGITEGAHHNNHATWYDAQVATYALYSGRPEVAREAIALNATRRILEQIEPDGSQPAELARTRAFDYSLFNLRALMNLARLGEQVEVDLWNFESPDGRSIRAALDWLIPFVEDPAAFPYEQIRPRDAYQFKEVLRRGARHYGNDRYEELIARLPDADPRAFVVDLIFPPERMAGIGTARWMPEILDQDDVYLPDFSYAGYRWGEETLPELRPTMSVIDFGATPDDGNDDTEAIRGALAAAMEVEGPVVLHFPAGRYILSDVLFIERGDLVLQGDGSGSSGTVLHFTVPLEDLPFEPVIKTLNDYLRANDKKQDGEWFSPFSWTGGLIWTRLPGRSFEEITPVLAGLRGEHSFEVANGSGITPGATIRLNWYNRDGDDSSLLHHIYEMSGFPFGERLWEKPYQSLITQDVTVLSVSGNRVTVKEPLLHDLRPEWFSSVSVGNYLENVGIEHLRVEMPDIPFGGHHLEAGWNAFYLTDLLHSWMRNVSIHNADSGILSDRMSFVTLEGIHTTGRTNHYSIHLGAVQHVLVRNFRSEPDSYHPISFNTGSRASVFTDGTVLRPMLDQHRGLNHQNLFDNITAIEDRPESDDLMRHGGAGYWGPVHGAFNTFWNVRAVFTHPEMLRGPVRTRPIRNGGSARIIGLGGTTPLELRYTPEPYTEGLNRPGIAVSSLYRYQLERRLGEYRAER
jgi:hypothetical protein